MGRRVSQMRVPLATGREPAGSYNRPSCEIYGFEHKTQYILLYAP